MKNNWDVFAWSHKDMLGIDTTYMCHELNIDLVYPAIKQKPWHFFPEKNKAINDEVDRLLDIEVIDECKCLDRVSNLVAVKKKNGKDNVHKFY